MQDLIAGVLRDKLLGLPFVSGIGGVVQTLRYKDTEGKMKLMPIDAAGNALVPNDELKGMIYFEHQSLRATGSVGTATSFESVLKLVFWGKLDGGVGAYNQSFNDAFQTLGMTPVKAQLMLMSKVPLAMYSSGCLSRLIHTIERVYLPQDDIFKKYTYPEEQTQYLLAPFTAFAFDIKSSFTTSLKCALDAL
jgi:hypothetical protein